MTCQVEVMAPDGSVTQDRALLDSVASTSLITELVTKNLHLPQYRTNFETNGVASFNIRPKGTISFKVEGV